MATLRFSPWDRCPDQEMPFPPSVTYPHLKKPAVLDRRPHAASNPISSQDSHPLLILPLQSLLSNKIPAIVHRPSSRPPLALPPKKDSRLPILDYIPRPTAPLTFHPSSNILLSPASINITASAQPRCRSHSSPAQYAAGIYSDIYSHTRTSLLAIANLILAPLSPYSSADVHIQHVCPTRNAHQRRFRPSSLSAQRRAQASYVSSRKLCAASPRHA